MIWGWVEGGNIEYFYEIGKKYNILINNMFENSNDKGLFTFYWEEAHSQTKNTEQSPFSLQHSPKRVKWPKKIRSEMEEKPPISMKLKQAKTKTIYELTTETHCGSPAEKQNREYMLPNTFDISSKLAKQLDLKPSSQIKQALKKHKQQKSCKLPFLKSTLSQELDQPELLPVQPNSQLIQKLVFKDQALSPRQLNLKMEAEIVKVQLERSRCVKKSKKIDTQRQRRLRNDKKLSGNFNPSDLGKDNKISARQLPVISPRTLANKRTQDYQLLHQIMTERKSQANAQGSVINIGVGSGDEYKQRWLKRREQFLRLMARNMSGQTARN